MVSFKNNTVHFFVPVACLFKIRHLLRSCADGEAPFAPIAYVLLRGWFWPAVSPTSAAWTLVIMINVTTAKMALSIVRIQRALRRRLVDVP